MNEVERLRAELEALRTGPIRQALLDKMADISEEYWAAGWYDAIAFSLWRDVVGEKHPEWGMGYAPQDKDAVRALAEQAGGWWLDPETFLPMDEWLVRYRANEDAIRAQMADRKARQGGG